MCIFFILKSLGGEVVPKFYLAHEEIEAQKCVVIFPKSYLSRNQTRAQIPCSSKPIEVGSDNPLPPRNRRRVLPPLTRLGMARP